MAIKMHSFRVLNMTFLDELEKAVYSAPDGSNAQWDAVESVRVKYGMEGDGLHAITQ